MILRYTQPDVHGARGRYLIIGTAAAIGIAAAASAGTSIASAKMGSNAAKNAAKIQADSAREGARIQSQATAPFTQAGTSAVNTLSRLLGSPEGSQFASLGNFQPGGTGGLLGPAPAPPMQAPGLSSGGGAPPGMTAAQLAMPGGAGMPAPSGPSTFAPAYRPPVRMPPDLGPVYDPSRPLRIEDFIAR